MLSRKPHLYDPKAFGKPQIRLPEDDQHGPNPYDSRSQLKPPIWMTWPFWFQLFIVACGLVWIKYR